MQPADSTNLKAEHKSQQKNIHPPEQIYQNQVTIPDTLREPCVSGLSEVVGHQNLKKVLMATIIAPRCQPQLFTNIKVPNSLLLFGPPGTGKTILAHSIAAEASAELHCVTPSSLLSAYLGESEK